MDQVRGGAGLFLLIAVFIIFFWNRRDLDKQIWYETIAVLLDSSEGK